MDGWEFYQKVDYEQIPYKCRKCHEYGHFVKNYPKTTQEEAEKNHEEGWKQTKRGKKSNPASTNNLKKWQENTQQKPTKIKGTFTSNQFDSLQTKEGEIPDLENQTKEDRIEASRTQSPATLSPVDVEEIIGEST